MGRDSVFSGVILGALNFNPRARVGRDENGCSRFRQQSNFNPRARVGRDAAVGVQTRLLRYFNPRARVGRDLLPMRVSRWPGAFQSTRPRGARPLEMGRRVHAILSSSQAPAWGGMQADGACLADGTISIHAPAWGATRCRPCACRPCGISIHAPAWGATSSVAPKPARHTNFNPRARVGRDK